MSKPLPIHRRVIELCVFFELLFLGHAGNPQSWAFTKFSKYSFFFAFLLSFKKTTEMVFIYFETSPNLDEKFEIQHIGQYDILTPEKKLQNKLIWVILGCRMCRQN